MRGWTSTSPTPAKRPTNWPPARMCSFKTTAPARLRTWACPPRNWPPAAPASSTLPGAPSPTTGRGPTGPGSIWKPYVSPGSPPTPVMNDYIAGYIGAAGIQAALIRRAKEGGSYHVRVNLARCAMWFMSLGTVDKNAPAPTGEQPQILAPDTITAQTPYGELVRLAPPVQFSETRPYWEDPVLVVRGSSKPQWEGSRL